MSQTKAQLVDNTKVTYTASGTGAVARSVDSKLGDTVSVKDFGAVGNWNGTTGTDDTAAFTAALLHCRTNNVKLQIPQGRYRITSALTFGTNGIGPYDGFDVEGAGQECTELVLDFNGAVGINVNPGTGGYTAYSNCSVGGFRVFVPSSRSVTVPFYVKNSYNARYHDLHIYVPLASVVASFIGMRVSAACYFNQFSNIWVEVYGGDATVGKAYYTGDGRFDIGLDLTATAVNLFLNCRTRGFGVGFDISVAGDTTYINCDAEVCGVGFRDLGADRTQYINCHEEGSTVGFLCDQNTGAFNANGTTFTATSDGTIVEGGIYEVIQLTRGFRGRLRAKYSSLAISANIEDWKIDSLVSAGGTITGIGNDAVVELRRTAPFAHNAVSLGSKRLSWEMPNTSDTARLMVGPNGDDPALFGYRSVGSGNYSGFRESVTSSGTWQLATWTTGAAIGSETPVVRIQASVSAINCTPLLRPLTDNSVSLGESSGRWTTVYATTGTINTSDANQKQQIEELFEAERAAAIAIKGLIRKFKFNDAVEAKGDDARIHVGVIAQDVEQAFIDEGLDPAEYGLFCRDEWWELDGQVAPQDTEGAEQKVRLGIRYEELLAFIIATL